MEIDFTFATIAGAILKLFVLVMIGYILRRRGVIDDTFTDTLSLVLIRVIFPALIFSRTVTYFSFREFSFWWALPLAGVLFSVFGMILGLVIYMLSGISAPKREFIAGCGFQNCGYLPMNIILFSFSGIVQDGLLVFLFLFIMGFNLLMWPLLPVFLRRGEESRPDVREILNPPVVATVISLLWVWFFGKGNIPQVILAPLSQLGQASFPIAMITLGAYMVKYNSHLPENKTPVISGVLAKLVIFPALALGLILLFPLPYEYKFFLFLQAVMPSAVSLVVIGGYTRADNAYISSVIFYTHLVSVLTIPLWLGAFRIFTG